MSTTVTKAEANAAPDGWVFVNKFVSMSHVGAYLFFTFGLVFLTFFFVFVFVFGFSLFFFLVSAADFDMIHVAHLAAWGEDADGLGDFEVGVRCSPETVLTISFLPASS